MKNTWVDEFQGAVVVCDDRGIILEINGRAIKNLREEGGAGLIGTSVLDCHPEPSRTKLKSILENRLTNAYTIEKAGVKKLIYQAPWFKKGRYAGIVEISLEIPFDLPHFVRK